MPVAALGRRVFGLEGSLEGPGTEVAAIAGGIIVGASIAALEAALVALGSVRLEALRDAGGERGATAARAVRDLDKIHSRLLAGRVLCLAMSVALSAWMTSRHGVGTSLLTAAGVAFAFGAVAQATATLARGRADRWALSLLRWLRPIEMLMIPLAGPLLWLSHLVKRAFPPPPMDDGESERVTALAVERIIDQGAETGTITADHAELLRSVLEFKDTVAHEVMVPRTQMVAVEISTGLDEVLKLIADKGHSRYPVYRERIDQVVGILYVKDLLHVLSQRRGSEEVDLATIVRAPAFFVAETQKIGALLREMQARRVHLAVVVDEFGGTGGIVTLEDILEEIVGDIRDEYDPDDSQVQELAPGRYLVDAGISVYDLEDQLGGKLREEDGAYDSLGGMIVELAGRVPAAGETLEVTGYQLVIREADERKVGLVELVQRSDGQGGKAGPDEGSSVRPRTSSRVDVTNSGEASA